MNVTDMSSEKRISPPTWTVSVPICSDQSWGPKTTHDLKRFHLLSTSKMFFLTFLIPSHAT